MMNDAPLFSDAGRRTLNLSESSSSTLGLMPRSIVQGNLLGDGATFRDVAPAREVSLAERVFKALADAKIWTSQVVMYMDAETRKRYFRQLDLLHDCDEWFGDQKPVLLESYKAFIRFMMGSGGASKPAMALSESGNLVAVWASGSGRLTVEFSPSERVEWVLSRKSPLGDTRLAGSNPLGELGSLLGGLGLGEQFGLV